MFLGSDFGKSVALLQRAMDVSVLRRQVISNNIANADTPNFKRSTVNFESELKRALDAEKEKPPLEAFTNDPRDLSFFNPPKWQDVAPRRVLDYLSQTNNNGNNVDLEQEMMDAQQNQMQYTIMAQAVSDEFNRINIVLRR